MRRLAKCADNCGLGGHESLVVPESVIRDLMDEVESNLGRPGAQGCCLWSCGGCSPAPVVPRAPVQVLGGPACVCKKGVFVIGLGRSSSCNAARSSSRLVVLTVTVPFVNFSSPPGSAKSISGFMADAWKED